VVSVLTVGRDVTELNASRRKIHQMAFFDSLTGLPNRALLNDRLCQTLADSAWHGQKSALMLIDMDRFKAINDTLGHRAGDQLLREAARRFSASVRPYDTVARLGGDEFTILLPDVRESEDLGRIADKLLEQFSRSFTLEGTEVFVSCSIGIAMFPQDSTDADELMKFADSAMYHAKQSGRNAFKFYSAELTRGAQERLSLEIELRRALDRGQLQLHYQPQVEMDEGRVVGSEALLRWQHPVFGSVPPARFIPIAEDTGLIMAIGAWVLQQAAASAVRWNGPGRPLHRVAVNVSPRQFNSMHFVDDVRRLLAEAGCAPEWIELEITERLLMDKNGGNQAALTALRAMGIHIAIDDFGTGYSALSYLTRFPLDTLKIDRSFIEACTERPDRSGLVGAVMAMARCLDLRVVAEGVESAQQAATLREQGCSHAQGYWYGRPMDLPSFEALPSHLPPAGPATAVQAAAALATR
jgi:diguanylate cyclase (GGDEF)-like protein